MRTAFKCRAYPDPEQAAMLSPTFGCVRVVWNKALAERQNRWRSERKPTSYAESSAALTEWKKSAEFAYLAEVSCTPLQQALRHQQAAFQNFFARRARHPRFKTRHGRQSAHYTRPAFRLRAGQLRLARSTEPLCFRWTFGDVDLERLDPSMVIVSRDPDGRWFVTFQVDTDAPPPLAPTGHAVGVDLGLKDFAVTSDGDRIANPRHLERRLKNLARYQRRMARCQKGSANRKKAAAKVARAHRRVHDARQDFVHRATTGLVRSADVIVIEDLAVANLLKNRRLARHIAGAGWGEFRRQLEYKCSRWGRRLVVVERWYPSSKTCSACGHVLADLPLGVRRWKCPACRSDHDRDTNAAKNILAAGLAVTACGAGVSHLSDEVRPAANQEPSRPRHARRGAAQLRS